MGDGLATYWMPRFLGKLFDLHPTSSSRSSLQWAVLLSFPLPYIANTAGWLTAELGRQPWLIYGLMRTSEGYSNTVSASNGLFTLLGFMGLYALLGLLFTVLMYREISNGPEPKTATIEPVHVGGE